MHLIAAFVFAFASFAAATDTCSSSDINGLTTCYQAFVSAYGFTMNRVIPHYWDVHEVRTAWLDQQGVRIQPKICQIGNALVSCISKFPCLSQDTFLTLGANVTEAPRWFLDKIATKYQCGDGYNTLMADYYCMAACREHRDDALQQCSDLQKKEIANGTDPCIATNDMITCSSAVYTTYCDYNSGVFNCGLNRAVVLETAPACKSKLLTCPNYR